MIYTEIGKLKCNMSKLGFGAMRLPLLEKGTIDQAKVSEMVDLCILGGINYFDTAYIYHSGRSEAALAQALAKHERSKYFLADKMPMSLVKNHLDLDKYFKESLERLNTNYIDFYLLHALSENAHQKVYDLEAVKWMQSLKATKKIKYMGFSIHASDEALEKYLKMADWDFVQIQYNYLDENDRPGRKGYERLVKAGIPIIIMEPLKGGLLANLPSHMTSPYQMLGKSPQNLAFRWLCEHEGVATILSGMSTIEQIRDNLSIFKNEDPLTPMERSAIMMVSDVVLQSSKVACTGCEYCMPCPAGVDISTAFRAWNSKAFNYGKWISGTDIDYNNARKCTNCKKCVSKCPQAIDIPAKLQEMILEK